MNACYLGVDSHGLHFSLKDSASLNLEADGKVLINGAMGITGIKKASTFTIGIVLVIITPVSYTHLNQDGQRRGLTQRAVGDALNRNAQNGADDHRKDNGQHGVHTRRAKGKEHNIAANHDNVAVGEVQHLGNAVDHRIAQGDQRVNAAQTDTCLLYTSAGHLGRDAVAGTDAGHTRLIGGRD